MILKYKDIYLKLVFIGIYIADLEVSFPSKPIVQNLLSLPSHLY